MKSSEKWLANYKYILFSLNNYEIDEDNYLFDKEYIEFIITKSEKQLKALEVIEFNDLQERIFTIANNKLVYFKNKIDKKQLNGRVVDAINESVSDLVRYLNIAI